MPQHVAASLSEAEACELADWMDDGTGDQWIWAWVTLCRRVRPAISASARNPGLTYFMPHEHCLIVYGLDGQDARELALADGAQPA